MLQAHSGYGRCGLGSDATDELVELAREAGPVRGVYGAKITGGGSGLGKAMALRFGALGAKVGAFVEGSANFLKALGLTPGFAVALILNSSIRGQGLLRSLFLLPWLIVTCHPEIHWQGMW